ncbi:trypsin [Tamaricihabitans halophyticus]|uniref:Trypsin n=1 Tax=Tamaricihabitans halophyticus TaxID=1262583 RepID=A0A4R2QHG9_9PSEU|nr:serine protease [Tamaricihabitans halophyticus]TCP48607.1 trypsin [Tamaricihabitans halophyticus]
MRIRRTLTALSSLIAVALVTLSGHAAAEPASGTAPLIVGGTDATEAYPFATALLNSADESFVCSASLVERQWVLTAAHCVYSMQPGELKVRVGSHDRTSGGEVRAVSKLTLHPDYDDTEQTRVDADIALVKLAEPVTESAPVERASEQTEPGTEGRLLGWGQQCAEPGGCDSAVTLQELDTVTVGDGCGYGYNPDTEFCQDPGPGKGMCFGDSGGPHLLPTEHGWRLAGVTVRLGYYEGGDMPDCGQGATIATDVAYYDDWIDTELAR